MSKHSHSLCQRGYTMSYTFNNGDKLPSTSSSSSSSSSSSFTPSSLASSGLDGKVKSIKCTAQSSSGKERRKGVKVKEEEKKKEEKEEKKKEKKEEGGKREEMVKVMYTALIFRDGSKATTADANFSMCATLMKDAVQEWKSRLVFPSNNNSEGNPTPYVGDNGPFLAKLRRFINQVHSEKKSSFEEHPCAICGQPSSFSRSCVMGMDELTMRKIGLWKERPDWWMWDVLIPFCGHLPCQMAVMNDARMEMYVQQGVKMLAQWKACPDISLLFGP